VTRRRKVSLALLTALVALAGLLSWRLPHWTASFLADTLSRFFHRPVTIGDVRFHLRPLEIEVVDLRVGGATPAEPPFLEVPSAAVVPSLRTLASRHIVLTRLRLERPLVRIHAYPQGGDDIPKMGGGPKGGTQIEVRRLVIVDGAFDLDHERVPLDLDLPDFKGRLARQRRGVLGGRLEFAPGKLRFGDLPEFALGTEMELLIEGPLLTVSQAHLRADKTDLAYDGWLRFGTQGRRTAGEFQLNGPVDLDLLERHVMRTGMGIKGDGRYSGGLTVEGSRLRLAGRLSGTRGEYDGVPVERFDGRIWWDERGVILKDLDLGALGGNGRLDLEVPPRPAQPHLRARLDGVDAEGLVMAVFDIGAPGVGASTTGEVEITWPRGQIRRLSGRIAVDLAPRGDARTPLSGRFEWRAERGTQFIERAVLHTPWTGARLAGRVEVDDRTSIEVDGESTDLARSDDLFRRLRLALGTLDAQEAGFSGAGRFRGTWGGLLRAPVFTGRFSGTRVGWLGVTWGDAEWAGVADGFEVRSHSLRLTRPGGELWVDGTSRLGEYGGDDGLDLKVRLRDWPAYDFIRAWDFELDVSGLVSGEAELRGRRSAPAGRARLTLDEGMYYGVPFEDLEVETAFEGDVTRVPGGRARVGGGQVAFTGSGTSDGFYDGRATFEAVDVARVLPAPSAGVRWGGRVSGEVLLAGTLDRPRVTGRATSARLFLGDEGVGALDARMSGAGDGRLTLDARVLSPRVDLALTGHVGAAEPYLADLTLRAKSTSLDPFLRVALGRLPPMLGVVAGGELRLRGPLLDPRRVQAEGELPALEVRLPEYPVQVRAPVKLRLADGRLSLGRVHLAGEGTDLVVSGDAALVDDGPLDIEASGAADLRALSFFSPRLRGRGAARLELRVAGTRDAPQVDGRLRLEGAGLRVRGFPHGVESLQGALTFNERGAQWRGVRGTLGGGEVELEGQAAYGGEGLGAYSARAVGRNLALRYPEGLRSLLDADLRLFGDADTRWIAGDVTVKQALYSKRYELASELLGGGAGVAPAASATVDPSLRYDVKVRIPGSFRIDNNLAALQARADLAVQGYYGNPVVLGRAEIERGRVYFQGNTYVIRRGALDFANPQKTDPTFDIEAESRVRSYRVTLKVNGTLERVYPTLTSDPPLSAVQILNLLAGADESTVASLALSQTEQSKLAAAGAATLAAGRIAEGVGLERGAEKLLGLNRFSIDPSVVKGGVTNPSARVTAGKRLTPDLNVQYSSDLRGSEDRVLSIEYTLSDRLSLLLTRAEPGGLGFDLRLRQSY
jgi:autotransporter translocation and assembly factor TamB